MPVLSATPDLDALSLTLVAELAAPPERVWQVWADPRQLERWWGPPTWPATFERLELVPGGEARYFMTGPDGTKAAGWWRITSTDEPHSLAFEDGFSDADGTPNETMPVSRAEVTLEPVDGGTRMTVRSTSASREQLQQLLDMGVVEGMTGAMGQIDALLAA